MNLDGLTLSVFAKELHNACVHKQIQKITQIDKHTVVFKLHDTDTVHLIITMGNTPACYVDTTFTDMPQEPTGLCMLLRKHYEGGRILHIQQLHGDRILIITIGKLSLNGTLETKQIYVELMGKWSNCIFLDNDIILESLIHVTPYMSQQRIISPKRPYELPPNSNRMDLLSFSEAELFELIKSYSKESIGKTLQTLFNGLSPLMLAEIGYRSKVELSNSLGMLTDITFKNFVQHLFEIATEIKNSTLFFEYPKLNGKGYIYTPILYNHYGTTPRQLNFLSSILAKEILQHGAINTTKENLIGTITQAINREEKRNKKIKDELSATKETALCKKYADLLMINAYQQVKYVDSIILEDILSTTINKIEIKLKPELTLTENANLYYKKYNKLKSRRIHGETQLKQSYEKLNYFHSILYSLRATEKKELLEDIKEELASLKLVKNQKKHLSSNKQSSSILTISIENGQILVGRNNKQNDYITHRLSKGNDMWFHASKIPGSHVILQTKGQATAEDIQLAAAYAATHSQANQDSLVPVDYTSIKYVKKVNGGPLGFVHYTHQKTLYVEPLKLDPTKKATT